MHETKNNQSKKGNIYTLNEIKDEFIGKKGTPKRKRYEAELAKELSKYSKKQKKNNPIT